MITDQEHDILYKEFDGCFPGYTDSTIKIGGINRHACCARWAIWLELSTNSVKLSVYSSFEEVLHIDVTDWTLGQIRKRLTEIYNHIKSKEDIFHKHYTTAKQVNKELKTFFEKS